MIRTRLRRCSLFVSLALVIAALAMALEGVTASASALQWQPAGTTERLALTVSGPNGFSYEKTFAAGAPATLRLQDLGVKIADGPYAWEMRVVPFVPAETRQKLAAARQADDDDAAARIRAEAGLDRETVLSGTFTVTGGRFVTGPGEEPPAPSGRKIAANALKPAPNDVVTPDDTIIQGSMCVGLDCVSGESFGFDTIRLKENNLRIKFEDTSTAAGFPNTNWQLTANDSVSGGANKFSIEDVTAGKVPFTIEGGASTNSLYVGSTGQIGLHTSTPVLDLHIKSGNTPAIRMEQTNNGGFTPQTWDIGANETNFFIRDLTGGSRTPLRIRPGAPSNVIDISSTGFLGVGTSSPSEKLHVSGSTTRAFVVATDNATAGLNMEVDSLGSSVGFGVVRTENNGDLDLFTGTSGATVAEHLRVTAAGKVGVNCNAPAFTFTIGSGSGCTTPTSGINPGSTSFTTASSRTFKENLAPFTRPDILEKIAGVGVYTYDFINGPKDRLGLVAEDFHTVFGRGSEKYIDGQDVQMALWLAVQQLTAQNKRLQERLDALERQLKQE